MQIFSCRSHFLLLTPSHDLHLQWIQSPIGPTAESTNSPTSFLSSRASSQSLTSSILIATFFTNGRWPHFLYPALPTADPSVRVFFARPHLSFLVRVAINHLPPHRALTIMHRLTPKASRIPSESLSASSRHIVNGTSGGTSPCSASTRAIASEASVHPSSPFLFVLPTHQNLWPTASALVRHSISVMQATGAQEVSRIPRTRCIPIALTPLLSPRGKLPFIPSPNPQPFLSS
jgi:hypothetical protein